MVGGDHGDPRERRLLDRERRVLVPERRDHEHVDLGEDARDVGGHERAQRTRVRGFALRARSRSLYSTNAVELAVDPALGGGLVARGAFIASIRTWTPLCSAIVPT